MSYTDLIFDLYGTLVDIHTEEDDSVWEKTALFFGFFGAHYTGAALETEFRAVMEEREAQKGQSYECFPDIPIEQVLDELFRRKGIDPMPKKLGLQASQLFRILSTEYIRLYPGVTEALDRLKKKGYRLWLLSNAQRAFTEYELRHLELGAQFDGIYLSSDYGYRKPDIRFFRALLDERKLDPSRCLMIGNDRETDIAGARAAGLATLYMHTNLTPPGQKAADPDLWPGSIPQGRDYEYEGYDWASLMQMLCDL